MKQILTILLTLLFAAAKAQLVSYTPLNGDFEMTITIQFNLNLSQDEKTKNLLGKTDGLYLWAGAGTSGNEKDLVPNEPIIKPLVPFPISYGR